MASKKKDEANTDTDAPDDSDAENKDVKKKKNKDKKKGGLKKIIIFTVIILILGGGGYFGYRHFTVQDGYSSTELIHIKLPEQIIKFIFTNLPDVYPGIIKLNQELILIDNEIARIDTIEKEYPEQKKITESEKKIWDKTRINLQKYLAKVEKELEAVYVTYQVNIEKGTELINSKKQSLKENNDAAIASAHELTKTLKDTSQENVGSVKKLLNKIMGK